jgi:hypothetical protein
MGDAAGRKRVNPDLLDRAPIRGKWLSNSEQKATKATKRQRSGTLRLRCLLFIQRFRFRSRSISRKQRKERKGAWAILHAFPSAFICDICG